MRFIHSVVKLYPISFSEEYCLLGYSAVESVEIELLFSACRLLFTLGYCLAHS
jgi:hypothetical protein